MAEHNKKINFSSNDLINEYEKIKKKSHGKMIKNMIFQTSMMLEEMNIKYFPESKLKLRGVTNELSKFDDMICKIGSDIIYDYSSENNKKNIFSLLGLFGLCAINASSKNNMNVREETN